MPREACIVATGVFGGHRALLKNRDRNYVPRIKLVHEVRDGLELAYVKDDKTGWVEGMNGRGVGVVNAALMVSRDESERDEVERTGKKLLDGDRILRALQEGTVEAVAKSVRAYKGGLRGHTIVSDGKKTIYVEMPDSNDVEYDDVVGDDVFVRTNHGVEFPDAGYVSGPREESSKSRQEEAEEVLSEVSSVGDAGPALLRAREDRWEPTEMVRDSRSAKKMRTTTQMVLDLTEKKLILYLIPGRVEYLGLDDRLPKDFDPQITVEVREYTDLTEDTDGKTKVVKKQKKARTVVVDDHLVRTLQDDVSKLVKAARGAKTLAAAEVVRKGCRRWAAYLRDLGANIRSDLEGRIREAELVRTTGTPWTKKPLSDPSWAKWHLEHLTPVWNLVHEAGNFPPVPELQGLFGGKFEDPEVMRARLLETYRQRYPEAVAVSEVEATLRDRPPPTRVEAEQEALVRWKEQVQNWVRRYQAKSKAAWDVLQEIVDWTGRASGGGGEDPVTSQVLEDETMTLEGLKVVFRGYDDADPRTRSSVEALKEALRRYRTRAGKVLPLLLKTQLPIIFEWVFIPGRSSDGATYEYDHILVTPWVLSEKPDEMAAVLAHEMGHHLYRTVLDREEQQFWEQAIRGDSTPLDLRSALPVLERLGPNTSFVDRELALADPTLFLQLGTLLSNPSFKTLDLWNLRSVREYVESGENPVFPVPAHPISGYAGKNSEEAFCEAVSRLVAYGPQALPDEVLRWLRVVLPSVRVGSRRAGLLPIMDPAYNVREVFKQLVLLEDHLFHERKRCPDCIWKHLLTAEALAEEAVTLDSEASQEGVLGLAEKIRGLQRAVQAGVSLLEVAQEARSIRKGLLETATSVKVAAETPVSTSADFLPFKPGDVITHGKFLNKPGQIVRMFSDDRGIPMIEVAPVGHARRKNRIMGLYRIRHADPASRVASAWVGASDLRCTEATLRAFGVDGVCPVHGTGVLQALREAGYKWDPLPSEEWVTEGGWGRDDGGRPLGVTLGEFVRSHPHGAYYLMTLGHAMALIDGNLTDTQVGTGRRRLRGGFKVWWGGGGSPPYEDAASQLRTATNPCSPTAVSFAWVDPTGHVHELRSGHAQWAEDYVRTRADLQHQLRPDVGLDEMGVLLKNGWIRVTNYVNLDVWDVKTPTGAAWASVVDIIATCVTYHRRDPFSIKVLVEESGEQMLRTHRYSLDDFVETFGGKEASKKLFEGLMARTARVSFVGRCASDVWYAGSPKRFDQFQTFVRETFGHGASEVPIFLTQDKSFARAYAPGPEGTVYTVRPKVQKTFDGGELYRDGYWPPQREDLTKEGQALYDDLEANRIFPSALRSDDDYHGVFGDSRGLFASILRMEYDVLETTEMKRWLRKQGYDSFYVTGDGPKNLAVFDARDVEVLSAEPAHTPPRPLSSKEATNSRGCSRLSHSFAWVDPDGRLYDDLEYGHRTFAYDWLSEDRDFWQDLRDDEVEEEGEEAYALTSLMQRGWVMVSNVFELHHRKPISPGQWKTLLGEMLRCSPMDFLTEEVSITFFGRRTKVTVGEILKGPARSVEADVYENFLRRKAGISDERMARERPGSHVAKSMLLSLEVEVAGDWIPLSSAGRIAAKYLKKKEVPKAKGKGTTTVYEYSERHVKKRHEEKAERYQALSKNIGKLRAKVKKDLKLGLG